MSSRSLNKVQLIGNLTRDVELRYTPQGTPVATIGLATNRSWSDSTGQRQEETEFHRLVAWNKLAELCSQLLFKGRKVYVEGRLQTRKWTGQDGQERQTTEVVIDDMIVLDSRRREEQGEVPSGIQDMPNEKSAPVADMVDIPEVLPAKEEAKKDDSTKQKVEESEDKEVSADDIPF